MFNLYLTRKYLIAKYGLTITHPKAQMNLDTIKYAQYDTQ